VTVFFTAYCNEQEFSPKSWKKCVEFVDSLRSKKRSFCVQLMVLEIDGILFRSHAYYFGRKAVDGLTNCYEFKTISILYKNWNW